MGSRPVGSYSHAVTLTLVHPVGDAVKDLVLFAVGGHLHSFSSHVRFEKNVVVGNINLQNTNIA